MSRVAVVALVLAAGVPAGAAAQRLPERLERGAPVPAFLAAPPDAGMSARAGLAGARADAPQDAAGRGVSTAEVLGGIAGSALGMWGGALAGLAVYEAAGSRCTSGCEDGGLGEGAVGLVVGSIFGTAVGTRFGAKAAHRPTGGFGKRVLAGGLGLLAGLAAFELTGHDADQAIPLIAFPVAQGVVGALLGRP